MLENIDRSFTDVYFQDGSRPVVCYRSGLTVYEEAFGDGTFYPCGWNASGYPLNVLSNAPSRFDDHILSEPSVFDVELDGISVNFGLEFAGCDIEKNGGRVTTKLKLISTVKPVEITVVTVLDGTQIFSRRLEIKNTSGSVMALSKLSVMAGGLEIMHELSKKATYEKDVSKLYSLGYMRNDDPCCEGDFMWSDLQPDVTSFAGRFGRLRHRYPMFLLRNNVLGTMLTAQLAWSAGYKFSFDLDAHPERDRSKLSFKAEITGYSPLYNIDPGEVFVSPELEIGMLHGDTDDTVNEMNAHLRRSVLNLPEADGSACYVGSGMGAEHDMSVETTKQFIDQMAYIGCEIFIVDAGWYCPPNRENEWWSRAGDWHDDRDRYPNGIAEIRDYCKSKDMKFGVWMEAERIGNQTEIFKTHPEWSTRRIEGDSSGGFLDFTNPEAAKWAEDEAARIISEFKLDLFRVDYNVGGGEMFHIENHGGRECGSIRHVKAVYRMYENLKKRFPNVVFENCAGGGGRCDIGMLRNFNHTWVSDNQVPPRSLMITNGMTLALPPERVDRLVAGMGCHQAASIDYHMRNAMFGHVSMNVFGPRTAEMNTGLLDFIRHSLDIYKDFIRPFLPEAKIYHHTPSSESYKRGQAEIIELTSADKTKAVIGAFTSTLPSDEAIVVYPRGLDASLDYEITYDNTGAKAVITGFELINGGLRLRIAQALSSELIIVKAI